METGQIVVTLGAQVILEKGESLILLNRHLNGDYGDVSLVDAAINDFAKEDGAVVQSHYRSRSGHQITIITEGEDANGKRLMTKIALPQELAFIYVQEVNNVSAKRS